MIIMIWYDKVVYTIAHMAKLSHPNTNWQLTICVYGNAKSWTFISYKSAEYLNVAAFYDLFKIFSKTASF